MRALKPFALTATLFIFLGNDASFAQNAPLVQCAPIAQRTQELGCWILVNETLGPLKKDQLFWHLDTYPTRDAALSAKGPRGTVVDSFGKNWLLSIEAADWKAPGGGVHVETIGPLPVPTADSYTATYMEAVFTPGMKSAVHDHPGPEAFYTLTGEACLETPTGVSFARAGKPTMVVAGGLPMQLTGTGKEKRQGIILILHDSSMPAGHPVQDWVPKGLCDKK